MNVLRRVWETWKRFGLLMGDTVARVVLTIFYFTIFLPFGLGMRLFGNPLDIRAGRPKWSDRQTGDLTMDDAGRLS